MINRVANNDWKPDENPQDKASHNALAAFGYYQAFSSVKTAIGHVLEGTSSAQIAKKHLHEWMRSLFQPLVDAGILRAEDLIGYRRCQVYIRGSRHIPFPKESLLDTIDAFFNCLSREPHAGVRAVLGHFLFVYIHPYMDGNGRTARFLMNIMLASGGYPWTVIQMVNRVRYFTALESASVEEDITSLVEFIKEEMNKSNSGTAIS